MRYFQTAQVEIIEKHKDNILPLTPAIHEFLKTCCDRQTGQIRNLKYADLAEVFECHIKSVRRSISTLIEADWLFRAEDGPRNGTLSGFVIGPEFCTRLARMVNQNRANKQNGKSNGLDTSIGEEILTRRLDELETRFSVERKHLRQKRKAKTNGHYDKAATMSLMFGGYLENDGKTDIPLDIS